MARGLVRDADFPILHHVNCVTKAELFRLISADPVFLSWMDIFVAGEKKSRSKGRQINEGNG